MFNKGLSFTTVGHISSQSAFICSSLSHFVQAKLNLSKTKLMVFNPCASKDFLPQFEIDDLAIQLVEETKLLGLVVTSDLSWSANTDYIVGRCNSKMLRIVESGSQSGRPLSKYEVSFNLLFRSGIPHSHENMSPSWREYSLV